MNGNANQSSTVVVSANNANNIAVSNNKRKIGSGGRQNSTRNPKTKTVMDKIAPDGIYGNKRFMNVAASMVGCIVRVHTVEGSIYEGVFRTFSPQFELVMEMGHKIDPNIQNKSGILPISRKEDIIPMLIFSNKDLVMANGFNVDLEYAAKDMSLDCFTDSAISKFNGQVIEKELEPWDGIGESDSIGHLDMENANGWDVNDMFRTNEQQYGVQSSYDHSLSGYTTQLEKKNTDEYKKQEAKALRLASEIESSSTHRIRAAVEDTDEDEKISAVVRTGDNFVAKYVPPQKRKNQHSGKLIRSNNINSSSQGGGSSYGGGRLGPGGLPHISHSQMHTGSGYNRLPPHSNNASSNNNSCPPQQQSQPASHQNAGHSVSSQPASVNHYQHNVHRQQSSPPVALVNNGASNHSVNAVGGNSSISGDNTNNNNNVSSGSSGNEMRKTSPLHHAQQQSPQSIQTTDSGESRLNCVAAVVDKLDVVDSNKNKQAVQQQQQTSITNNESVRREAIVANEARNDNISNEQCSNNSNVGVPNQQSQSSNQMQLGISHIQPKLPRKTNSLKGSRDEQTADLKKFQTNFKLVANEEKEESNSVATPTVDDNEVKDKVDSDLEKTTNGVKKFTLNPNAKEFVLNPNAKAFTPRTPSAQTPTPPRAHTPGAMITQPATISLLPGQQFIMPQYVMQSSQLAAVSLPSPMGQAASALAMHPGGAARFRKSDATEHYSIPSDGRRYLVAETPMFPFPAPANVQQRPDYTGAMAAAATGPPILASTTHPSQASFVQYPPQAMVAAHGTPQPNMPYATQMYSVIGPRLVNPQGLNMMPGAHLVQHTDPQHVPSQMFISAHHAVPPPGPTPPHANHTPIPNLNQGGPHNASNQGQPPQQNQVGSMHPNPSPVHGGGNTPTQQNPSSQPQNNPNAQQLNAYSNPHAPQMSNQLQAAPHTPNSPQSMHPGQVNNSNPTHYLQAASLVAHAASNASPHANQAHSHPTQGPFQATQMVLLPPPGPGTPTSITGHPTMTTHTIQGHVLGHGGMAQLVPNNSMVIPATTTGQLQAGTHQMFIPHPGRPNALQGRVVCAVPTPAGYQL